MIRNLLLFIVPLFICVQTQAQEKETGHYFRKSIQLDRNELLQSLKNDNSEIKLELETGITSVFTAFKTQLIHPKFNDIIHGISTYRLKSTEAGDYGALTTSAAGVYIFCVHKGSMYSIFPRDDATQAYILEKGMDRTQEDGFACNVNHEIDYDTDSVTPVNDLPEEAMPEKSIGEDDRKFFLATSWTGEFYMANNGNWNALITSTMNAVEAIYFNEFGVSFQLFFPPPAMRYTDPATDPFIPDNAGGSDRTTQAAQELENAYGTSSIYDFGHVFHRHMAGDNWSTGGVAGLGVVCNGNALGTIPKFRGWSGGFDNEGNDWIVLVAHEIGHQFNATHTFNGDGESCTDNIAATTAYEIGSGTTIMSYNGLCFDEQNVPSSGTADNYFHVNSVDRITSYLDNQGTCSDNTPNGNTPPVAIANPCGATLNLPKDTPFFLTGMGTDMEGDDLTYCWEQYDEDGSGTPTQGIIGFPAGFNNRAPIFRSFPPATSPTRYFPRAGNIVNNFNDPFDVLPRVSRELTMRLTVRDNNPNGGGIHWDEISINVLSDGPFEVLYPNGNETLLVGAQETITWDTDEAVDACNNVRIELSIDGGLTFPFTLAEDYPFMAESFSFTVPNNLNYNEHARIKISCTDYECFQFYDMSDNTFTLNSPCFAPSTYLCDTAPEEYDNGDPGLNFNLGAVRGVPTTGFSMSVQNNAPVMPITMSNSSGNCELLGFNNRYETEPFSVTVSGEYQFDVTVNEENDIKVYSIYEAANFNPDNPCPSFVASNAIIVGGGGFAPYPNFTANLDACTDYILVYHRTLEATVFAEVSNISGPGFLVPMDEGNPDYALTFIALNTATNTVDLVNPEGDFTALDAGTYELYAMTYKVGGSSPPDDVNPDNLAGMTLDDIYANGSCIGLSLNSKPLVVNSTCTILSITPGNQSTCDPNTNTYTQELIFEYETVPETGEIIVNGQMFPVSSSPQSVTLFGLLSDGQGVDVTIEFTDDASCKTTEPAVFTAPVNCCPIALDLGDDFEACATEDVTLDAGPDGVNYTWLLNDIEIPGANSSSLNIESSGLYSVVVENASGCRKPDEVNVTLQPLPTVELGENVEECMGNSIQLTAQTETDNTIKWFIDGNEIPNATFSSLTVANNGTYTAEVTNGFGCTSSDDIMVTFNPLPELDLGDDLALCEGEMRTIEVGSSDLSYSWIFNNGPISPDPENIIEIIEGGTYLVFAVNAFNCTASDTAEVTYFPLPQVDLGQDQVLCDGDVYDLMAATDAEELQWFADGTNLNNDDMTNYAVSMPGQYLVIVTSEQGCVDSASVDITYNPVPGFDLGGDQTFCVGETYTIEAGTPDLNYEWLRDGVVLVDETTNQLMVTESGIYSVNATNAFNCTNTQQVVVDFIQQPVVDLGADREICEGTMFAIVANSNVTTVSWIKDGIEIPGETSLELQVSEPGTYIANVGSSSTCEDSDTIIITAIAQPSLDINGPMEACVGDEVTLMAESDQDVSYQWGLDGNVLPGATGPTLDVSTSGAYSVIVTNTTGCENFDTVTVNFTDLPDIAIDGDQSICEGTTFTINVESDATTIMWLESGVVIPGATEFDLTVSDSGMYEAVVMNDAGCTTSAFFTLTVDPLPVFDLGGDRTVCAMTSTVIEGPSDATYTYQWSLDGNLLNNTSSIEASQEGLYGLTITNQFDCQYSDSIQITVAPVPAVDLGMDQSFCEGLSVTLETDAVASFYMWTLDGVSLSASGASLEATMDGTYILTAENMDGCSSSDTLNVVVFDNPVVTVSDVALCPGNSETLTINQEFASYEWVGLNSTANSVTIDHNATATITTENYAVIVTDDNGCTGSDEFAVTFFPVITAVVDDDIVEICIGQPAQLGVSGGLYYAWNNAGTLNDATIANPIATPSLSTLYTVVVSDDCPGNEQVAEVEVIVNPPPMPMITRDTCVLEGQQFQLQASGGTLYQWDNAGSILGSNTIANPIAIADSTTTFTVTVTDANGCTAVASVELCIINDPLSVLKPVTVITPNGDGLNDALEFRGLEAFPENRLVIFNRWGAVLYEHRGYQVDAFRWEGLRDGTPLPADTYYYILEFGEFSIKNTITIIRD